MGLLDILTGMQNGPRGQPQPSGTGSSSGGMSPITMALLALLAYKGYKHFSGTHSTGGVQPPLPRPPSGGGLGDILGGRGAGSVLNGGLGNLIRDMQNAGQGRVAQSWIGKGANEPIEPNDLAKARGADTINALSAQTGMSREDLLQGMSQQLPEMVDKLTPDGRLPTEQEAEERWTKNEDESENENEGESERR